MNRQLPWAAGLALVLTLLVPSGRAALPSMQVDSFATGFTLPILLTHAGDGSGRIFVVQQDGLIYLLDPAGGAGPHTLFLDISSDVITPTGPGDERGLLGMAFHPDYDGVTERRFYLHHSASGGGSAGNMRVVEYQTSVGDPDTVASGSSLIIQVDQPQSNHNGGMIQFAPDGMLHIALGDGGGANDSGTGHSAQGNGQDNTNLLGAILRIDIDGATPYAIPTDNPFADGGDPGLNEIYIMGMRNPYRFSIDAVSNHIFIGDVGQGTVEEVDVYDLAALPGTGNENNAGWRILEGDQCFNPSVGCVAPTDYLPPHHTYLHSNPRDTVIGGYVHRGSVNTSLNGLYFFGDYGSGEIWVLPQTAPNTWDTASSLVDDLGGTNQILSFGQDESGEVYVCRINGEILRINDPTVVPVGLSLIGSD